MGSTNVRVEKITYHVSGGSRKIVVPIIPHSKHLQTIVKSVADVENRDLAKTQLGIWINPIPKRMTNRRCVDVKVKKLCANANTQLNKSVEPKAEAISYLPKYVAFEDMIAHHIGAVFSKLFNKFTMFLGISS